MARTILTHADVAKLLSNPSPSTRVAAAEKVAKVFDGELSAQERELAEKIFRIMVHDAEVRVREALSRNLKSNPLVPHDVAVDLAKDVNAVALPILEYSEVLTDEDLIEIVRLQDTEKQVAIAGRPVVSESVSDAIVDAENEAAVTRLVSNPGAAISDGSLDKVVTTLGDREGIQKAMAERPRVPVTIAERLVTLVTDHLQKQLTGRGRLSVDTVTDLVLQIRERAVLSLSPGSGSAELTRLVRQLHDKKRLTPSIMLRALCMGDLAFFETAMAERAGLSPEATRELIYDGGQLGLRAIVHKAGFPRRVLTAIRAAVDVAEDMEYDGGDRDRERYSRRMIERILTQYGDLGVEFEDDDLEYLLAKMNTLPIDPIEWGGEDED